MGAVSHGQRSGGERFFSEPFKLCAKSGVGTREHAKAFDGGTTYDVRRIVIERHEQTGGAPFLASRFRGAGDDQSEMGAGSPVVVGRFTEEIEQPVSMRDEQRGLCFCYAARGVGGALSQQRII